jgi:hypothetical protein
LLKIDVKLCKIKMADARGMKNYVKCNLADDRKRRGIKRFFAVCPKYYYLSLDID